MSRTGHTVTTPMLASPVVIFAHLRQEFSPFLVLFLSYPIFFVKPIHTTLWNFKFCSDYERKGVFFLGTLSLPVI